MNQIFHDAQLQLEFNRSGFAVTDFLSPSEVQHLHNVHKSLANDLAEYDFSATIMSHDFQYRKQVDAEIKRIFSGKIDSIFRSYRLCYCSLAVKKLQGHRGHVSLHQDWSFVDETKFESVGIWCPLVDVDSRNGCLEVLSGSHRFNRRPRGVLSQFVEPYREIIPVMKRYLSQVPMKSGQAFLFSQRLFHSSPHNQTESERVVACGLVIPTESRLRCYHQDPKDTSKIEILDVPDDFYVEYLIGIRPPGEKTLETIDYTHDPITEEALQAYYARLPVVNCG